MSWYAIKKDGLYLDSLGGPRQPPPRWGHHEDATRYRDKATAIIVREVYGGTVVKRTLTSFKARAEKAELSLAFARDLLERMALCRRDRCPACETLLQRALATTSVPPPGADKVKP